MNAYLELQKHKDLFSKPRRFRKIATSLWWLDKEHRQRSLEIVYPGDSRREGIQFLDNYTSYGRAYSAEPYVRHKGWYLDEYGDQTIMGVVLLFTNNTSVVGYSENDNPSGAVIDFSSLEKAGYAKDELNFRAKGVFDDWISERCLQADQFAEYEAEQVRNQRSAEDEAYRCGMEGEDNPFPDDEYCCERYKDGVSERQL